MTTIKSLVVIIDCLDVNQITENVIRLAKHDCKVKGFPFHKQDAYWWAQEVLPQWLSLTVSDKIHMKEI